MAESKIINNAARVLKLVAAGTPADQALRESLTQDRHFTAPAERRGISRAVFAYFRWWRWLEPKDSPQKQLAAALELQKRFDANPAGFKPEALADRAVPDWLKDEMAWPESVGAVAPNGPIRALEGKRPYPTETAWLQQLQREPALWIRAKAGTGIALTKKLSHCIPASQSPDALRYTGLTDLYRTKEFQAGEFEIQDLASQLVGLAAAPKPGETWWDACAGEGGKTMHLSDLMQNKGLLWASDRSVRRLAKLKDRAARAQVFNFRAAPWEGDAKLPTKTKFDGILVDAPCSGVGTWQRNPHSRWTTLPKDVHELAAVQQKLLNNVAGSLKPGGRLVYTVCTLTRAETADVAAKFTSEHSGFEPSSVLGHPSPVTLWPHDLNANGMFIAIWRKR
ncbi:RsmB/NOP family class I SAM-dependent RNA methyltransferase [Opitutus sp. GAS368]|uniref:RsmB/NOP family class I SAM-dependent RNA methyltransferase n=1 Tax=Opitutus sp. GAS368 TaxID=1882749 RepID=UPI00087A091D|nr:RsmB/NOP family class I SAM-dependent RNA methyltransferase [Opitutus sp. GAS368]SDR70241.1 16S rRNA (cytosine967-C5)-methyltransferase [Opitutus sp. GAS368]